jgi:hypothetical protein
MWDDPAIFSDAAKASQRYPPLPHLISFLLESLVFSLFLEIPQHVSDHGAEAGGPTSVPPIGESGHSAVGGDVEAKKPIRARITMHL